ncbi:hypothetical protein UFOVP814_48 [uncultured Caudovirales phage]|uniref:Uncharacterized protein n=1 Tax=uncultured Caudovirales phage TaxID=2100421 RepID=A0A6J5NXZ9_9CAUD|nr:hypothetical protein UFOVP814_48 [uncultured Caudovirales phage]
MIKQFIRSVKLKLERAALVRELETLYATQAYIAQREKEIIRRAAQIDCESITTKNQLARGW